MTLISVPLADRGSVSLRVNDFWHWVLRVSVQLGIFNARDPGRQSPDTYRVKTEAN